MILFVLGFVFLFFLLFFLWGGGGQWRNARKVGLVQELRAPTSLGAPRVIKCLPPEC